MLHSDTLQYHVLLCNYTLQKICSEAFTTLCTYGGCVREVKPQALVLTHKITTFIVYHNSLIRTIFHKKFTHSTEGNRLFMVFWAYVVISPTLMYYSCKSSQIHTIHTRFISFIGITKHFKLKDLFKCKINIISNFLPFTCH